MARKTTNKFWSETLYCWSKFIDSIPINNVSDALSRPLWNNLWYPRQIFFYLIGTKMALYRLRTFFFGNGKFISQNDLKMVYHIRTNFLEHHRVSSCVKNYLSKQKDASKMHKKPTVPIQIKIISKSMKGSQDFYRILANQNMVYNTTYYSFWEQALGITICSDMWKRIFQVCFKTMT